MFTLHNKFTVVAKRIIKAAIEKAEVREPPVLVGIHIRRTDYKSHLTGYKAMIVSKTYFDRAKEHFRQKYKDNRQSPLFLVVSDDKVSSTFSNGTRH